jgi:hypothetical protein
VVERHARALHAKVRALAVVVASLAFWERAEARPNTHAPAISTWDPRASSVVFGLGRGLSGAGSFTFTSYSANFSSTNGVLSAQFGVHYTTFRDTEDGPTARGVSAGGVALISLPLSDRFDNGVPGSAFAFYVGGVPTAMFSGQLNFISVPLVLGVGLPFSPSRHITFRPWVELSPGLNFDTRIQEVATAEAIQSAMDGTLTREEVEALVEEGLDIQRETTVGKRAGLSFSAHLGERVDFDVNMMLGAGQSGAFALGAAVVLRWDRLVHELDRERVGDDKRMTCEALAATYHRRCRLRPTPPGARSNAVPRGARLHRARPNAPPAEARPGPSRPAPDTPETRPPPAAAPPARPAAPAVAPPRSSTPAPAPATKTKNAAPLDVPPATPSAVRPARPAPGELPPLQAAPPRTP